LEKLSGFVVELVRVKKFHRPLFIALHPVEGGASAALAQAPNMTVLTRAATTKLLWTWADDLRLFDSDLRICFPSSSIAFPYQMRAILRR